MLDEAYEDEAAAGLNPHPRGYRVACDEMILRLGGTQPGVQR